MSGETATFARHLAQWLTADRVEVTRTRTIGSVAASLKVSTDDARTPPKHRPEFALDARRGLRARGRAGSTIGEAHECWFVRYILLVAFEATLQEALKMSAAERAELIERLIDSLDDNGVEASTEELAELDDALVDADRAVGRGELIPCDEVLARMRQIS